jgi:hypothetical protein
VHPQVNSSIFMHQLQRNKERILFLCRATDQGREQSAVHNVEETTRDYERVRRSQTIFP